MGGKGAAHRREAGHGWWPYILPYMAFLGAVELTRRLSEEWGLLALLVKIAVPGGLLVYFAWRGAYPELRRFRFRAGAIGSDVMVGLALAGLWMTPYVFVPAIVPADTAGFDPEMLGPALVPLALGLRMAGYGLVTPFFEEIFIRGFVMRVSTVMRLSLLRGLPFLEVVGDFRGVPLAQYSRASFIATTVVFAIPHAAWEYWVAIPWVILTNLWFYYRKDLYAVILVHATTNAAILLFVALTNGHLSGPDGQALSLWFFV